MFAAGRPLGPAVDDPLSVSGWFVLEMTLALLALSFEILQFHFDFMPLVLHCTRSLAAPMRTKS